MKYLINEEIFTDRRTLQIEFNLSKTKLHRALTHIHPKKSYRGCYLYNYDDAINYLKNYDNVS